MTRADRGIERLDFATWNVLIGGRGGNPSDLGIKRQAGLVAPRVGVAYRIDDNTVFRAGYGITYNPLPWSRPLRGFYPADDRLQQLGGRLQLHRLAGAGHSADRRSRT